MIEGDFMDARRTPWSSLLVSLAVLFAVGWGCNEPAPVDRDPTVDTGVEDTGMDEQMDTGPDVECMSDDECDSGVCTDDGECADPTCEDGVQNGDETDVDCGGPDCQPCSNDGGCGADSDCSSGVCDDGTCQSPGCSDEVEFPRFRGQ